MHLCTKDVGKALKPMQITTKNEITPHQGPKTIKNQLLSSLFEKNCNYSWEVLQFSEIHRKKYQL